MSQVLAFVVLSNVSHFWERNIVLLPILLEEVRCIPDNIFCKLYVVKVWEGMVRNSLSCHTIPKPCMLLGSCVPFLVVLYLQYCMLEDSSTKSEMCDMYICVRGIHGKTLVGRNHIGTEISTSVLQPMKKLDFGR